MVPGLSSSSSGSSSTSRTESHSSSSSSTSSSSPTVSVTKTREREDRIESDISPVTVSTTVDERSGRPDIDQANKNPKLVHSVRAQRAFVDGEHNRACTLHDHARRGSQVCKKSGAPRARSQSGNGEIAVRARNLMRAEMVAFAFVLEVKSTDSGSTIDTPLSTANIRALLRPRLSPLEARAR